MYFSIRTIFPQSEKGNISYISFTNILPFLEVIKYHLIIFSKKMKLYFWIDFVGWNGNQTIIITKFA